MFLQIPFFLFLQDTPLEKLDKKHFAKGSSRSKQNGVAATLDSNLKEVALMEAKVNKLCELLADVRNSTFYHSTRYLQHPFASSSDSVWSLLCVTQPISRTKENIVKKESMTYVEIEAEREEVIT